MTEKTDEAQVPEGAEDAETAAGLDEHEISQWEFVDRVPTREEVVDLLKTLPPVWGVATVDFADYVQGLPSTKKVTKKVRMPNGSYRKEDEYHEVVTLYMSVAGRVKMAEQIALVNGWRLDFEPEPVTPTGVPGFVSLEQRIVYREYAVFWTHSGPRTVLATREQDEVQSDQGVISPSRWEIQGQMLLGRKPGIAWVPFTGGKQAAGSNPYEKVETSARGRALAAWGIGVLPGSGIASLEEMLGVPANRAALEAQGNAQRGAGGTSGGQRKSREEMIEEALTLAEQVRQMRGISEEEMRDKIGQFLSNMGIRSVYDAEAHEVDWQKVKDGQVQLLVNGMADSLRQLQNQESAL